MTLLSLSAPLCRLGLIGAVAASLAACSDREADFSQKLAAAEAAAQRAEAAAQRAETAAKQAAASQNQLAEQTQPTQDNPPSDPAPDYEPANVDPG